MQNNDTEDSGTQSSILDDIRDKIKDKNLESESEAQTRFDIIDRLIREVLGWKYGQITVEERQEENIRGYVDYILKAGDVTIVVEAKKVGASFPTPTKAKSLKLSGIILKSADIGKAINQAKEYAKSKIAQITVVTNGVCWCYFKTSDALADENTEAGLLFPFEQNKDAEELFHLFSNKNLSDNGLKYFSDTKFDIPDNKLLRIVRDSEVRIGRNNVADYIAPALDGALHSESIANNHDFLKSCFVYTTARTKFDRTLSMYLVDTKPVSITPAKRIRTANKENLLGAMINYGKPVSAPPVTLLIADVGVGKSTYLRHFELVSGKNLLEDKKVHWIYIDFETMGRGGDVRKFIYQKLKDYLLNPNKTLKTDFENSIEPAYHDEIEGLKQGPYSLIKDEDDEFRKIITSHIQKDFEQVEPYVDKVFKYISRNELCVLVLDNTDLYEDEEVEKSVLSEGLALAKKLFCYVIISIRDTTFVRHQNDAIFDAFELKKLWLDPPPFKEVLSKRLTLSSLILKGKSAVIPFSGGVGLRVDDLSVFFEIVQRSILDGAAGDFLESFAGLNIRKGLALVINFLDSGHIHADKALRTYMTKREYVFPFQEVFKGSIMGQWRYFKEKRCDCVNLFDSKLGSKNLRLLRLCILAHLHSKAKSEDTAKVPVSQCINIFSKLGANSQQIIFVLDDLLKFRLIKSTDAVRIRENSIIYLTRVGGYHFIELSHKMPYVESCMYDTAIDDVPTYNELAELTRQIELEQNTFKRMKLRESRFASFINYVKEIESKNLEMLGADSHLPHIDRIIDPIAKEFQLALTSISKRSAPDNTD